MIVLGIDPGIAIVGFGLIQQEGNHLKPIQYGSITTKAGLKTERRLKQIYDGMTQLFNKYKPDAMAIEKLYFNRNVTTAFTVGQARGVMLLAAEEAGVDVAEYTPLQIKQAVVGYGQAEKNQVQEMVKMLLHLKDKPKPDDVADGLAVAICHAHSAGIQQLMTERGFQT